jgi:hypothetical protein
MRSSQDIGEVVFIDPSAPDIDVLRAGLRPGVAAILLTSRRSAAEQMQAALRERCGLAVIHVIAHGQAGEIRFAAGPLSLETVGDHAAALAGIGLALAQDGELRLWVCNAAEGERGAAFVTRLATATGTTVRASTGRIGAAAQGGSWTLDTCGRGSGARRNPSLEGALGA